MIGQAEIEEIIELINSEEVDLKLLSFELDIPMEQIEGYKEQLRLRKFAKESIKNGKIEMAIEALTNFIETDKNNIVERMMLLKLKAYANKTNISEEDLQEIEEERKKLGFPTSIDAILEGLGVQIPKRKASNLKKKEKQISCEQEDTIEQITEVQEEQKISKPDYTKTIERYKKEIAQNPQNSQSKRNLLAFAYFKAGRIEEARDELISLIDQNSSFMAYRQLIHLEKSEGNFEDARLWAEDCLDRFPSSTNVIAVRQQLVAMAKREGDIQEVINQLKKIISISPDDRKANKMLKAIIKGEER